MKLGSNLPQFGSFASPENIALVAQEAEQLGCDAVWGQERLLRPTTPRQPYDTMTHWPEAYRVVFDPIETLSYAAATHWFGRPISWSVVTKPPFCWRLTARASPVAV
jgi:alkanesulfonate monooxygenase SsuD/methylene tetrahydromethanopterin reductase-like flavin-dependent oxidoreductase (luciferase family)